MPEQEAAIVGPARIDAATAQFFFQNSVDMLALVGVDGLFKVVNDAWTGATGWRLEQLVDARLIHFVHPDDQDLVRSEGQDSLAGETTETTFRFRKADGDWLWLRSRARLTRGGVTAVMRDVTDELRREAELADARRARELVRETAGVGAWRLHPEKGFEWSPELTSLSPHLSHLSTPEEFQAQVHPEDLSLVKELQRRGILYGEPAGYELRFRGPDGGWRHFRSHFHTRPLPGGLFELIGVAQEVTELARARDQARAEEARARSLIEGAPFALALFDRELRYTGFSPRWAEVFEIGPGMIGQSLLERPNASERFVAAVRAALAGETPAPSTDTWRSASGEARVVRWTARPHREAGDSVAGAVVYVDDVTEFQASRRAAETSARRLNMALVAASAGVIEIDFARARIWSSPEFDRIIGRKLSFGDVSQRLWPLIQQDDQASIEALTTWWRNGAVGPLEFLATLPMGERRWLRMFFDVERSDDGVPLRMSGLALDVDAAKRQELALIEAERRAQAAAEAKSEFLANMSHEIRTPLNGVLGVLHLLKAEPLSRGGRDLLDEASGCGRMLAELLNDVIDFSRIEEGRLELHPEPTNAAELARGVARLLAAPARSKGLQLRVEAPETHWVSVDPVRLRQTLFNLVGNAVKFTTRGGVTVQMTEPSPGRLCFEVADTGPGIAADDQAKLFGRFQQVDGSTTRRFGGSGLGLAITRRLAELMGGQVKLDSQLGRGSTFTVEVDAPTCGAGDAAAPEAETPLGGLRVLLVEDNPTNQLVIRKLLESLGADVATAEDGRAGVAAAATGAFDLILMDVQMPVMDGVEAVGCIRALPEPRRSTPVLALTANALAHQAKTYLAAGMDGVVSKPVSPAVLLAEIARVMDAAAEIRASAA
jgi:PAS domain S-box-containing protein